MKNKKTLVGIVGTAAAAMLVTFVPQDEGMVYKGYRDMVGIPTKCAGDTDNVVVGRVYSKAECAESLEHALVRHADPVMACTPGLKGRPFETYAAVSLAYNIGTAGYCKSTAAKLFNQGNYPAGCRALGRFVYAGGRKVRGLELRRQREVAVCLKGTEA